MQYKVLALDLDGTLTNSEKIITPRTKAALREAAAHGVRGLAYDCDVTPDSLCIRREVPVILQGANFI